MGFENGGNARFEKNPNGETYTVKSGDTLQNIARAKGFGNDWKALAKLQPEGFNAERIIPGQKIILKKNVAGADFDISRPSNYGMLKIPKILSDTYSGGSGPTITDAGRELDDAFDKLYPSIPRTSVPNSYSGVEQNQSKLDSVLASLNNTSVDLPRRLTLDGGVIYDNWSEFVKALDNRPEIKNRIQQMIANLLPQGNQIDANRIKIGGLFSNNAGKGFIFSAGDEQYVFLRGKNDSTYSTRSLIDAENPTRPQVLREDFGPSKDKDSNRYNTESLYTESGSRFWQGRLRGYRGSNGTPKELPPSDKEYFQTAILHGITNGKFRNGGANEIYTPQFNTNGIKPSDIVIKDYDINGITFQIQGKDGVLKFDNTNQIFTLSKVEARYA